MSARSKYALWLLAAGALLSCGAVDPQNEELLDGESAALRGTPVYLRTTASVTRRVDDLLRRMSLEEKLGQMTQVDRQFLNSEDDIATYKLGSLLSGGGSV